MATHPKANAPDLSGQSTPANWPLLIVALLLPTVATWLYFIVLSGKPLMQAAYAGSKVVQFALPVVWFFMARRRPTWTRPKLADLAQGAAFGLLVVAATMGLYYGVLREEFVSAGMPRQVAEKISGFGVNEPVQFMLLAVFIALFHSLLEEYYWRWFVFGEMARRIAWPAALVISSWGFMAHHVLVIGQFFQGYGFYTWFFSSCVAVGGGVWAWLFRSTGSLYGPWLSHLIVDTGLMWLGYDLWRQVT